VKASPLVYFTLLCAVAVHAQGTNEFDAALTGSSEVPPNSDQRKRRNRRKKMFMDKLFISEICLIMYLIELKWRGY
jgi:hypothetical protein